MSRLSLTTGQHFEWDDYEAAKVGSSGRTEALRTLIPTSDGHIDGVVKVAKEGRAPLQSLAEDLQREARRMREVGGEPPQGSPPFLPLLFEDADPTHCPTFRKDGTETKCVAIGMPLMAAEEWVEQSGLLLTYDNEARAGAPPHNLHTIVDAATDGSTAEERRAIARDLLVITDALALLTKGYLCAAERGLLLMDHFMRNIFLKRSALQLSTAPSQQTPLPAPTSAAVEESVRFIDMADMVKVQPSPLAPPPFMGPNSTLMHLREARRKAADQTHNATCYLRPPEMVLAMVAAAEEDGEKKAADPSAITMYKKTMNLNPRNPSAKLNRIRAAYANLKKELVAEGVLVGEGETEAIWIGRPSLKWGASMLANPVLRGQSLQSELAEGQGVHAIVRAEVTTMVEWAQEMSKWVRKDGRPLDKDGDVYCPLDGETCINRNTRLCVRDTHKHTVP
ncbi:unnamed protein product [Vitrella brassicaformis CCMP3155]|uniref:Uncharacterized protein n=1 Tax=Vitrella brassicaformis (strain CCMP3155) TaxID=1169540 RepID=A0A0G4EB53_VITBC|nr:unnamed protein product [Vitrella brassicaformis CCMP3155]|eukprot:CEL92925.1 unnamed protein product [Vitrella brassicaformis CCMP3155]